MRAIIVAVAVAAPALAAPSLAAADTANELTLGPSTRALRSPSADALTGDTLDGGAFAYARRLIPLDRLSIWAEGGLTWGTATGEMFQTMGTEIDTFEMRAGVRARYQLHHFVALGAAIDVGTARASLTLDPSSGAQLADSRWGALVSTAVSADFYAINVPRLNLGLRLELGYVKTAGIDLHPTPANTDDTIKLPMSDTSIGHLDLSGPAFTASLVGRF